MGGEDGRKAGPQMTGRRGIVKQYREESNVAKEYLINYEDLCLELAEMKNPPRDDDEGLPRAPGYGDPTSSKAIALTNPEIVRMEKRLDCINEVVAGLPLYLEIFLRHRRKHRHDQGPKGWVYPTQRGFAEDMSNETRQDEEKTWRSRIQLYRYQEELINITAREMIRKKLL